MSADPLIIILGATAAGKTKLAVETALELDGEIISADSRQIFRKMNLGTGKDLQEYSRSGRLVPYHLIDILDPGEKYHVDAFKNDFYHIFQSITARKKMPILCGGTGMYVHSILQHQPYTAIPVNQELRNGLILLDKDKLLKILQDYQGHNIEKVDRSSQKRLIRAIEIAEYLKFNMLETVIRPEIKPVVFGLKQEVQVTRAKILKRLDERLENGMIEEARQLLADGISLETLIFYGLEYKFMARYLNGELDYNGLRDQLGTAICQYAKRQHTFFRKMEKDGVYIHWLDASASVNLLKQQILQKVSF